MSEQPVKYGPGQDRERERDLAAHNARASAAVLLGGVPNVSCVRPFDPDHRATDTRLRKNAPPGYWVCGVCHPSPLPDEMLERRADLADADDASPEARGDG